MTKDNVDEVRKAANYGAASYNVDNNDKEIPMEVVNEIVNKVLTGSTDNSFLYELVREVKESGEKKHGKNR